MKFGDPQAQADPDELRQYPWKQQYKSSSPDRYYESTELHNYDPDRFNTPMPNEASDHMRPSPLPNKFTSKKRVSIRYGNMEPDYLNKRKKD